MPRRAAYELSASRWSIPPARRQLRQLRTRLAPSSVRRFRAAGRHVQMPRAPPPAGEAGGGANYPSRRAPRVRARRVPRGTAPSRRTYQRCVPLEARRSTTVEGCPSTRRRRSRDRRRRGCLRHLGEPCAHRLAARLALDWSTGTDGGEEVETERRHAQPKCRCPPGTRAESDGPGWAAARHRPGSSACSAARCAGQVGERVERDLQREEHDRAGTGRRPLSP